MLRRADPRKDAGEEIGRCFFSFPAESNCFWHRCPNLCRGVHRIEVDRTFIRPEKKKEHLPISSPAVASMIAAVWKH
jgi:hypothetical protein